MVRTERILRASTGVLIGALLAAGCSESLIVPSEVGTIEQLVNALRAKGLEVSVRGETSPQRNGYFSVPSRDVMAGEALLKAFEYGTASKADADAALVNHEGQPNPRAAIDWISGPHFFKQGRLIVLYVGCAEQVLTTLADLMGPLMASGPGC